MLWDNSSRLSFAAEVVAEEQPAVVIEAEQAEVKVEDEVPPAEEEEEAPVVVEEVPGKNRMKIHSICRLMM